MRVATSLRWGGYCRMGFVANFICFPVVQKFWKSVKIWQSYREFKGGNFFKTQLYPSVCLSVCLSIRPSHACFVTKRQNILPIFWYHMKGKSLHFCDINGGWWVMSLPPEISTCHSGATCHQLCRLNFNANGWWMSLTAVCYWIITGQNTLSKWTVKQWFTKEALYHVYTDFTLYSHVHGAPIKTVPQ